jgi:hypothetical protein
MQMNFTTYGSFRAVTPSDTTPVTCRAIYVASVGQITIASTVGGTAVSFGATVPVGTILPIMLEEGTINAATAATVLALA